MKRLIQKYNAEGALVVTYPVQGLNGADEVSLVRFDKEGQRGEPVQVPAYDEKKKENLPLPVVVQATIRAAEEQQIKVTSPQLPDGQGVPQGEMVPGQELMLPAEVPVDSLAQWAILQRKLMQVEGVSRVTVQSMTRGLVRIEIASSKSFAALQESMASRGLYMALVGNGSWEIRTAR
jgi:hypothetical protein